MMLAFRCSRARAESSVVGMNQAMALAECSTVRRCAMWCGQVGHETLSLFYDHEVWGPTAQQLKYDPASGSALSKQLGNTQPGDGRLYAGAGRIQLTGRANFGAFSRWCYDRKLVATVDHFVRFPELVATAPWRDLAAAWYWTVARRGLNAAADRGDVRECTRLINGGYNGLADRQDRYDGALRLDRRLLPDAAVAASGGDWFDMATEADLRRVLTEVLPRAVWEYPIPDYYGDGKRPPQGAFSILAWACTHAAYARDNSAGIAQLRADVRGALAGQPAVAGAAPADLDGLVEAVLASIAAHPLHLTRDPAG